LQVKSSSGEWITVAAPSETSVKTSLVACTATRLDMFDKLAQASDPPILQSQGWLVQKTADAVDVQGFTVHDNLREMMLCEDSANHSLLSELDQQEFLYKLFCHLVLGGQLNQYEDDVDEYRQAVKSLYRTLIRCERCLLSACVVRSATFNSMNNS
jgi:cilia- and flagella-associated protein 300